MRSPPSSAPWSCCRRPWPSPPSPACRRNTGSMPGWCPPSSRPCSGRRVIWSRDPRRRPRSCCSPPCRSWPMPGSPDYVALALTLTLMVGVMELALGLARMGTLVNFISHSVIVGFTAAAALLIAAKQLKHFFGIEMDSGGASARHRDAVRSTRLGYQPLRDAGRRLDLADRDCGQALVAADPLYDRRHDRGQPGGIRAGCLAGQRGDGDHQCRRIAGWSAAAFDAGLRFKQHQGVGADGPGGHPVRAHRGGVDRRARWRRAAVIASTATRSLSAKACRTSPGPSSRPTWQQARSTAAASTMRRAHARLWQPSLRVCS